MISQLSTSTVINALVMFLASFFSWHVLRMVGLDLFDKVSTVLLDLTLNAYYDRQTTVCKDLLAAYRLSLQHQYNYLQAEINGTNPYWRLFEVMAFLGVTIALSNGFPHPGMFARVYVANALLWGLFARTLFYFFDIIASFTGRRLLRMKG